MLAWRRNTPKASTLHPPRRPNRHLLRHWPRQSPNCKSKYRRELGCGYRSTFIREGWSLVLRCGDENIIVAAKTLHAAEQAAVNSELTLRRDYKPEMPPCTRIVSVKPDGRVIAPDVAGLPRFVNDRTP